MCWRALSARQNMIFNGNLGEIMILMHFWIIEKHKFLCFFGSSVRMRQGGRGTMLCDARKGTLRGFKRRTWGVAGTPGAGCGGGRSFAVGMVEISLFWGYFGQNRLLARAERAPCTQLGNFWKLHTLSFPTPCLSCFLDAWRIFWTSYCEPREIAVFCWKIWIFKIQGARQSAPGRARGFRGNWAICYR